MTAKTISMLTPRLRFAPHPLIRNRHVQTVLSSLQRPGAPRLYAASQEMILDAGDGVRLQGFYSPQPGGQAKGVVLLLHGWLGCADSSYVIVAGERLYRHGYSIFRLNLRDHGATEHLNPGIFRSDRLAEVAGAARQVAHLEPELPLHIAGASLGGSFALRLAWWFSREPLPNLGHTIAICPLIDPNRSTLTLDRSPFYLFYFRRRWRRAFRRKQAVFPDRYDFRSVAAAQTCMEMTERFMRDCGPYPDAKTYFAQYTITPAMLAELDRPTTMITAVDDPIIPAEDFHRFMNLSPNLQVSIQPYGGHVGFVDLFPYRHWIDEALLAILG